MPIRASERDDEAGADDREGFVTDPSRSVSVKVASYTRRVEALRISPRWRERVDAAQLADAVVATIVMALAVARADPPASVGASEGHAPGLSGGSRAPLRPAARTMSRDEAGRQRLLETARRIDRLHAARQRTYVGSDDRRHATFRLGFDGQPVGLDLEPGWLAEVRTERLVETLHTALRNAYDTLDAARRELEGGDHTAPNGSFGATTATTTDQYAHWGEGEGTT